MTADELRKAEARYQRAYARSETAREARNAAVQRALDAGWTHARIAEATGLTRSRVGQIALMDNEGDGRMRCAMPGDLLAGRSTQPREETG